MDSPGKLKNMKPRLLFAVLLFSHGIIDASNSLRPRRLFYNHSLRSFLNCFSCCYTGGSSAVMPIDFDPNTRGLCHRELSLNADSSENDSDSSRDSAVLFRTFVENLLLTFSSDSSDFTNNTKSEKVIEPISTTTLKAEELSFDKIISGEEREVLFGISFSDTFNDSSFKELNVHGQDYDRSRNTDRRHSGPKEGHCWIYSIRVLL